MATKKTGELDYTNQPQATNQAEVDAQDTKTRLYQSLGYSYGKQQEESDKSYDQAISQQDRSLLSRGMQRSSYGMNTLANLRNQKNEARNKIGEAMIADYQSRVAQREETEAAQAYQTAERKAQQDWQSAENALNRAQSEKQAADQIALQREQMAQDQSRFEVQQAFSEKQWQDQLAQYREDMDYKKMSADQQIAYNIMIAQAENGQDATDDLLRRVGISREDFNAIKAKAATYTGTGKGKGKEEEEGTPSPTDETLQEMLKKAISSNTASGAIAGGLAMPTQFVSSGQNTSSVKVPISEKKK